MDFAHLGYSYDYIYVAGNMYPFGSGGSFQYSKVHLYDKTALFSGALNSYLYYYKNQLKNPDGSYAFSISPARSLTQFADEFWFNTYNHPSNATSVVLWFNYYNQSSQLVLATPWSIAVSSYSYPDAAYQWSPNPGTPNYQASPRVDTGDCRASDVMDVTIGTASNVYASFSRDRRDQHDQSE